MKTSSPNFVLQIKIAGGLFAQSQCGGENVNIELWILVLNKKLII